ncbi:uncharacterized protein [Solanum tuberosum]|uniref:uncharacterized protein n=1 Tax=Solanum tuberosum TaxID=4113 RepID=UPI00073A46A4|nr:PREDICTED: uncharacterized protein LOC107063471 [Solanum tuberosum]
MVMQWWMTKTNNKIQETMHQMSSYYIYCAGRYGKTDALLDLKALRRPPIELLSRLHGNSKELCTKIERVNPVLNINFIKWRKPPDNYLKLNTDGCSKGNPGEAGGGGILRDHQGNINMAFQTYFGNCSNNMAEGLAILKGLQWCVTNHLHNVIIKTNFMIMKGKNVMMWQMQDIVMQIIKIMKEDNFQINHCFREVADALAQNTSTLSYNNMN